ncbi:glutaredoxin 1 [Photobacterium aphoticum]|uniref:Glutaredoxin 1 n=1 Tax=Photobacterium aphoticum TaxID=754436 RepID=A0A090QS61_9GAMM|nr:glutaredoxin 1 [Photobacterium aphoticum]
MFVVIFGRPGCPFCVRAKELADKLKEERDDFNYRYVDIHAEGISKADLEKTVGKPVETVPQIFIDQEHIGGCTDFEAYAKETWVCSSNHHDYLQYGNNFIKRLRHQPFFISAIRKIRMSK